MTEDEVKERLAKDSRYFIEHFLFIIDQNRKKVPFLFKPAQIKYSQQQTNDDLILKARKEGFSSQIEAEFLHACIFGENENCVTMSHSWADTLIHLDRVKYFIETMGTEEFRIEVPLDKDNQRELYFPHSNSRYWIGTAGSKAFGRGRDVTKLHLSEAAHYEDQTVLTGILEACVPGARKVLETTARGVGEMFYSLWKEATDPDSGSPWKPHFFAWFDDPSYVADSLIGAIRVPDRLKKLQERFNLSDRQIYWYHNKEKSMPDKALMPQEFPSEPNEAFLSSGRHCFNLQKLQQKLEQAQTRPPQMRGDLEDDGAKINFKESMDGHLKVWKAPRHSCQYLISADAGKGVQDGDWSVAQVFDRSTWEQVAVWRGRPDPGTFGQVLCDLGTYYNNAILVPELNESGWAVVERIKSNRYPHLLNTRDIWDEDTETNSWDGFPTTTKSRSLIITAIRNAVDDDTVYFNDPTTINEMMTFIQNPKTLKFEAQLNCWDDCVISSAIGIFCLKFFTVTETYGDHHNRAAQSVKNILKRNDRERGRSIRRSGTNYRQ